MFDPNFRLKKYTEKWAKRPQQRPHITMAQNDDIAMIDRNKHCDIEKSVLMLRNLVDAVRETKRKMKKHILSPKKKRNNTIWSSNYFWILVASILFIFAPHQSSRFMNNVYCLFNDNNNEHWICICSRLCLVWSTITTQTHRRQQKQTEQTIFNEYWWSINVICELDARGLAASTFHVN